MRLSYQQLPHTRINTRKHETITTHSVIATRPPAPSKKKKHRQIAHCTGTSLGEIAR